jgi:hypothetical protein
MRASPCGRSVVAEPLRVPIQIVLGQFQRHAAPHPLQSALRRNEADGSVEEVHEDATVFGGLVLRRLRATSVQRHTPAIEGLVPRGGRLPPFLLRIAVVIARELPLGGELIEVLLIAPNREVAVSRPDLADLQPVVERRLRCIHTHHEEWRLVLAAGLARPDRRLARASLHRVHTARIAVAREPQHRRILEPAIDARGHDPKRLTGVVQMLGKEQSFEVIPYLVAHDVAGDHMMRYDQDSSSRPQPTISTSRRSVLFGLGDLLLSFGQLSVALDQLLPQSLVLTA